MTENKRREAEHDERLAALYVSEQRLLQRLQMFVTQSMHMTGGKVEYERRASGRGYREWMRDTKATEWGTRLTAPVARERLDAAIAASDPTDEYGYGTPEGIKRSYNLQQVREVVNGLDETAAALEQARDEYAALEESYTGWSRFFLVTSSRGHIHSSMNCSTCNKGESPTTFGWMPNLSGLTEADAVAELGPNLCTVCFPSAPTEWVGGWITEAQAKKKAEVVA